MFKKTISAIALIILMVVLAPLTASAHGHTLYGPKLAPNGVGQNALYRASEWNGAEPTWYGSTDWWIVSAPADPSPDLKRRSEFKVGTSWEAARYTGPGKKMQWKGYLKPVLGAAKNDGRSWHSLVQLHGPDAGTGAWTYSQVALRVEMGNWVLWGDDGSNVAAWKQTIMPYVDDYATYAMITYRAEAAPLLSQVCVTLDPAWSVAKGDPPPVSVCHWAESWDSQWVDWQAGLYRGSGNTPFDQGGIQPTYEQHVFVKAPFVTIY
jgi:hypothetical protein